MDRMKKLVLILVFFIITLSSMFLVANKSYAEDISNDFAMGVTGKFNQKSMAGIYYAMRTKKSAWVNSKVPDDLTGWATEYRIDSLTFNDTWGKNKDDNNNFDGAKGMIYRVGGVCFGHHNQSNNGDVNNCRIKVFDVDKDSDETYQELAYDIFQAINNKEYQAHYNTYQWKESIRYWLINHGNLTIQTNSLTGCPTDSESPKKYATYITKIEDDKYYEKDSNPTIIYKNGNTFIGPYKVKFTGDKEWSQLDKASINETISTTYCSINGSDIKSINNLEFNKVYDQFYIVVKGKEITSVDKIEITKNYSYYKARLVASEPKARDGQNVAVFYGYKYDDFLKIKLPGVPYTKIKIIKTDADTNETIKDEVRFIVEYNGKYLKKGTPVTYTTNKEEATQYPTENGIVEIDGIKDKGTYKIYEVGNSNKDYLEATVDNPSCTKTVEVTQIGGTIEKTIPNSKAYHLKIRKVDKDSGDPLENVGFILYKSGEGYIVDGENGKLATYTNKKTEATIYKTDTNGETIVENLPSKGPYTVYEVENPNFGYQEVSLENPLDVGKVTAKLLKTDLNISDVSKWPADKVVELTNKKIYIKLSGYAWEDIIDPTKKEDRDNVYDTSVGKDERLNNIPVRLVKTDGTSIETITSYHDGLGNGSFIFGNYDENPNATKILIEDIEKGAYIQFYYNGLNYETVDMTCITYNDEKKEYEKVPNGNTAREFKEKNNGTEVDLREEYNNYYGYVKYESTYREDSGGTGFAFRYDYNNETYSSTLNYGSEAKYGYDGAKYPILTSYSNTEHSDQFLITARTETNTDTTNGYDAKTYRLLGQNKTIDQILATGSDTIENINLGLYERDQPDLALDEDVYSLDLEINGYTHTYEYAKKYSSEYRKDYDIQNAQIKFQDKYDLSYTRAVYASDCQYTGSNPLAATVTYKIEINNEATALTSRVNSLMQYYEADDYKVIRAYAEDNQGIKLQDYTYDNGGIRDVSSSELSENGNWEAIQLNTNLTIPYEKSYYVYVVFRIEDLGKFFYDGTTLLKDKIEMNVAVEINSYSTFYDDKIYAGIDEDSRPGSLAMNNYDGTKEDDTSWAPSLGITLEGARSISGTVFLDNSEFSVGNAEDTHTNEERNGDGEYQDGTKEGETPENTISGVTVKLYTNVSGNFNAWNTGETNVVTGNASGTIVYLDENDNVMEGATATGSSGKFKITDFIPGEYVIVYTWGNNTYIQGDEGQPINVSDYKGTIYKVPSRVDDGTHQWYQENQANNSCKDWYRNNYDTRYSDAVDNYELRKNIDSGESDSSIMLSRTPAMRFGIEYADDIQTKKGTSAWQDEEKNKLTFNIPKVDFGITERARQEIAIDKRIDSVKLTLANGQDILYATYDKDIGELVVKTGAAQIIQHGDKSDGKWTNGQLWESLDNELIQGSTLEITYKIIVNNNSEIDYDSKEYYLYGPGYGEEESKIVKQHPQGVYDYLDKTMSFDASKQEETTAMKVVEIDTAEGYNESQVKHNLIEGYLNQYEYSKEDENGVLTSIKGYEYYSGKWIDIIKEYWEKSTTITNQLTQSILNEKTIIEIEKLEQKEILPGDYNDVSLKTSKQLTSTDEIALDNEVEIVDVKRTTDTGRKITVTSSELYNRGETVVITPPTGDDQNYLPYIILGITSFILLGTGVVFIKKKVLR